MSPRGPVADLPPVVLAPSPGIPRARDSQHRPRLLDLGAVANGIERVGVPADRGGAFLVEDLDEPQRVVIAVGCGRTVDVGHLFEAAIREVLVAGRPIRPVEERCQTAGLVEGVSDARRVRLDHRRAIPVKIAAVAHGPGARATDPGQTVQLVIDR